VFVVSGSGREFVSGERRAAMRTRLVVAFILKMVFIVSTRRVETALITSSVCCDDFQLLFEDV
jgi:hypothetical protein